MSSAATAHRLLGVRPRSAWLIDTLIAAAALVGSIAQLSHGGVAGAQIAPGQLDWTSGALAACSTLPLLGWRLAPRATFTATASASVLLGALGYPLALALGSAAALYFLAASRNDREPWTPQDAGTVVLLFVAYVGASGLGDGDFPGTELLHTGLAWAVAWFAGERTRLRHEHIVELAERALRAEREAERERLLAIAEERTRIARDLHDSAGHAINVIAMRAGTARLRRDPERSQEALAAIEELARRTGGEIDQLVGNLREPRAASDVVEEPPGLASLDALIARQVATGLDATVVIKGRRRQLDPAVDQAAYRILQEALNNAARHGGGSALVELAFDAAGLELTVGNDVSGDSATRSNGGHGLIGMRERAALVGGSLHVERPNGSFCVRARLPYGTPPA